MTRRRPGDRVTVGVTDTAGRDVTATLTVTGVAQLGCGCQRLTCDRPGPVPRPGGVHVLTGCTVAGHASEVIS